LSRLAVDVLEGLGVHPGAQDVPDLAANKCIGIPMVKNAPAHPSGSRCRYESAPILMTSMPVDLGFSDFNVFIAKSEGRDKAGRFFQYFARFLKSFIETQLKPEAGTSLKSLQDASADVMKTLGSARRTHRFCKEFPVIQSLPALFERENNVDKFLEMGQKFTLLMYLMCDHMAWLKQNKIRRAGKRAGAGTIRWGMFFFMISNAIGAIIQYRAKKMASVLKQLLLVQQCAHLSGTFETHDMLVGLSGVYTSYVDCKAQWPSRKK